MKKFYGAIIDGVYICGEKNGVVQLSDDFDEFLYSENKEEVVRAIKGLKERFPDHDIRLGTITLEVSDVQ